LRKRDRYQCVTLLCFVLQVAPEEAEKRQVRRERNKAAAAKCRQRRVDQTNTLINETENLEEDNAELENEIQNLKKQAEELKFLLEAHRPSCKHSQITQQQHQQQQPIQMKTENYMSMPCSTVASTVSYPMARPSTLPLRTTQAPANTAPMCLTTPSSGVNFGHLGLETLMDGHTGLTPLTAGPPPPSCSSQVQQQHRNSSDSSSSPNTSPNTSSAQLISL